MCIRDRVSSVFTKLNRYEFRENLPEIGSFALPIFIEQAAIAFMSVISSIMVSNIGISAVSGVNLVETLNVLIQQIFMSLEIGATVVVAQFCGKNDLNSASEASVQAMFTSVSLALVCLLYTSQFKISTNSNPNNDWRTGIASCCFHTLNDKINDILRLSLIHI